MLDCSEGCWPDMSWRLNKCSHDANASPDCSSNKNCSLTEPFSWHLVSDNGAKVKFGVCSFRAIKAFCLQPMVYCPFHDDLRVFGLLIWLCADMPAAMQLLTAAHLPAKSMNSAHTALTCSVLTAAGGTLLLTPFSSTGMPSTFTESALHKGLVSRSCCAGRRT